MEACWFYWRTESKRGRGNQSETSDLAGSGGDERPGLEPRVCAAWCSRRRLRCVPALVVVVVIKQAESVLAGFWQSDDSKAWCCAPIKLLPQNSGSVDFPACSISSILLDCKTAILKSATAMELRKGCGHGKRQMQTMLEAIYGSVVHMVLHFKVQTHSQPTMFKKQMSRR